MPKFAYVASTPEGALVEGVTRAANLAAAEKSLADRALANVRLTEKVSKLQLEVLPARVKREDVMHLTRQLGAFIHAGLPLLEAVHTLAEEAGNPTLRRILGEIEEGLRRGETLSECLARHPKVFPEYYLGIVASAELTGQLDTVLGQLAKYMERDMESRRKIQSAMVYPSVVAVMSLVTVVVLAVFVLPRFRDFFSNMNAKLPLPTRALLAITAFVGNWWWALLGGTVVVVLAAALAVRTQSGRYLRDRLLLATPVLGTTIQFTLVERFCRILASMASAGVALPEALRVATGSLRNLVFTQALGHVGEALLRGEGIARPLAATGLFPGTAARMMRVGEDTGTLDNQLEVTAEFYEGELDYKIKKLTSLFEPAILVVMGGVVGFVAIALVSAMYGIFSQVKV